MIEPMDTLVGKFNGNAKASFFYEPALNLVERGDMICVRKNFISMGFKGSPDPVKFLVDIGNTVFPYTLFSFGRRFCLGENPARSVERGHLTRLFFKCHLRHKRFQINVRHNQAPILLISKQNLFYK